MAANEGDVGFRQGQARPNQLGGNAFDGEPEKEGLAALLPDFLGYGVLYGISAVPIFIAIAAIVILFVNSLQ